MPKEVLSIGGQAVIEGVMMRTKDVAAVAVRNPKKKIVTKMLPIKHGKFVGKLLRVPVIRGFFFMIETLKLGFAAINYSASISSDEEEETGGWQMAILTIFSLALGIGLFIALPYFISSFFTDTRGLYFNAVDGVFRILVFVLYLLFISSFKDVRRLFMYHGAEHMTVAAFENKEKLTIKNVRKYSPLHPRCGTAFLLIVLIISIIVFSLVHFDTWWLNILSRVLLIPLITGIAYEALKLGGKHHRNPFIAILVWPGLALQLITTKPPTNDQIEVAIAALKKTQTK